MAPSESACAAQREPARPRVERVGRAIRVAQVVPLRPERRVERGACGWRREGVSREARGRHLQPHRPAAVDAGPAVGVPGHRREEGLASEVVPVARDRAEREEDHPPGAVRGLDEVRVAGALDRHVVLRVPVREDRVAGAGFERSPRRVAARDRHHVAVLRPALGDHQVVPAADLVEVRPLRVAGTGAVPDEARRPEELPGRHVDRRLVDPAGLAGRAAARAGQVRRPVVVEEERRVDPAEVGQPDGLGPRAGRVLRGDEEVPAAVHVGRDHVERAGVVPEGRSVDAARRAGLLQGQLALARQDVAQLPPVHQVAAREDRHAGEELEAARDEVEVVPHAHDARVGVEPRDHGVAVGGGARGGEHRPVVGAEGRGRQALAVAQVASGLSAQA